MENISIIVPTFNDEQNIKELVRRIHAALSPQKITYEIIFIDDYSTDKTVDIITGLKKDHPIHCFFKNGKKGKAFSLKQGFDTARYENLCMIDADLQYPPEEIPRMLKKLEHQDVAASNRKNAIDNFVLKYLSPFLITIFGKYYYGLKRNNYSGLIIFKKKVWEDIAFTPLKDWSFALEFYYLTRRLGFKVTSVNIDNTKKESKLSWIKPAFNFRKINLRNISISRSLIIILLVLNIVFISQILYTYRSEIQNNISLATSIKPETYTELFFENHLNLPSEIKTPKNLPAPKHTEYSFKFTIRNLENKNMKYPYEVYMEIDGTKSYIEKETVLLKNNETKTIQVNFSLPNDAPRLKVVVDLIDKRQQIAFWISGRGIN